jgi:hypothetical protein
MVLVDRWGWLMSLDFVDAPQIYGSWITAISVPSVVIASSGDGVDGIGACRTRPGRCAHYRPATARSWTLARAYRGGRKRYRRGESSGSRRSDDSNTVTSVGTVDESCRLNSRANLNISERGADTYAGADQSSSQRRPLRETCAGSCGSKCQAGKFPISLRTRAFSTKAGRVIYGNPRSAPRSGPS